jgi:hypothetical protein
MGKVRRLQSNEIYCWTCGATNPKDFYLGICYRCMDCCDRWFEEDQELARTGKSRHCGLKSEWNSGRGTLRWKMLRIKRIAHANGQCERCGISHDHLHVHHLTYERYGGELLSDLQALCPKCHTIADWERRKEINIWIERAHRRGEMLAYAREVEQ